MFGKTSPLWSRVLSGAVTLQCSLCFPLFGQWGNLPSRNSTRMVECHSRLERGSDGRLFRSYYGRKLVKSSVVVSTGGARAYAIADATAIPSNDPDMPCCSTSATLYVAPPHEGFRAIKTLTPPRSTSCGGSGTAFGVDGLYWSPNGSRLAVDFTQRDFGTDEEGGHTIHIFELNDLPKSDVVSLNEEATKTLFGKCSGQIALAGWLNDHTLRLLVSRLPDVETDDPAAMRACSSKPLSASFDLLTRHFSNQCSHALSN